MYTAENKPVNVHEPGGRCLSTARSGSLAFALIEFLVVIAIIAILAVMLLPAFALPPRFTCGMKSPSMRALAAQTACQSRSGSGSDRTG